MSMRVPFRASQPKTPEQPKIPLEYLLMAAALMQKQREPKESEEQQ
jgi:hypothetical protein